MSGSMLLVHMIRQNVSEVILEFYFYVIHGVQIFDTAEMIFPVI